MTPAPRCPQVNTVQRVRPSHHGQALLAAAGYALMGKECLPSLMSVLGCLMWSAQALAAGLLLRRALGERGAVFVAAGIALGAAWSQRFVALETNLVAAVVLWAMVAALHRRWMWVAAACAAAGLLRPDAYLAALVLGVACIRERGWACWKPACLGLALSAPWYAFAAFYFGSILPQSALVKTASASAVDYAFVALQYISLNLIENTVHIGFGRMFDPRSLLPWLSALAGAVVVIRRDRHLALLPAWGALHIASYLGLRAQVGMEWHLYPGLLVIAILSLAFVYAGMEKLVRGPRSGWAVGIVLLLLAGIAERTRHSARIHARAYPFGARDGVYREVGETIRRQSQPGDEIVATEVGTIAYYSEMPMIDLAGLVTPRPRVILRERISPPRWLVTVPAYGGRGPSDRLAFISRSEPFLPGERELPRQERFVAAVFDAYGRGPASEVRD